MDFFQRLFGGRRAHRNRRGQRVGYTDSDGRHFDQHGQVLGYTDSQGRIFDAEDNFKGWQDEDGIVYDPDRKMIGWRGTDGYFYNASGQRSNMLAVTGLATTLAAYNAATTAQRQAQGGGFG